MYSDKTSLMTFRVYIFIFTFLMLYYSTLPTLVGISGTFYLLTSMILGVFFFFSSMTFIVKQNGKNAKYLLKTTIFYLPLLLLIFIIDTSFFH